MNCQEALELLYDIIDKEADDVDIQEVESHLSNCRHCFELFRIEKSVQEFIDSKLEDEKNSTTPAVKLDNLRSNIMGSLDEIDKAKVACKESQKHSFFSTGRMILAAAALILFVGGGFLTAKLVRHYDNYIPIEKAHMSAVESKTTFANYGSTNSVQDALLEEFEYSMMNSIGDFELIGAQTQDVDGVEMYHLLYGKDNQTFSMFIVPNDNFTIPSELIKNPKENNGHTYYVHECKGCRVFYQKLGQLLLIAASSDFSISYDNLMINKPII
jgi:anti-sigma factor (TIGR02949 family)